MYPNGTAGRPVRAGGVSPTAPEPLKTSISVYSRGPRPYPLVGQDLSYVVVEEAEVAAKVAALLGPGK
ncbi:MAG: hypothetical protein M3464_18435 [Chloroflexota bacterium]|nr:hypothetical protein [Chloroflexota bacterium]